jgi:hypothetical protein
VPKLIDQLRERFHSSPAAAYSCVGILVLGSCLLTAIGGEAGGDHIIPWLWTLIGLSLVWLLSLGTKPVSPWLVVAVAVAIRGSFLIMPTGFDTYRYVWEGKILAAGFNPYIHPPDDPILTSLRDANWHGVGLRGATAIYPPLTQWVCAILASFGLKVWGFKLVFTLADLTLCYLLMKRFGANAARIYAWNPLAALSFAGGGHYDSLFILAMVVAWLVCEKENDFKIRTAVWIGISIGLKWMALPIGLWLVLNSWKKIGLKKAFLTGLLVSAPVVISYIALSLWTKEWTLQLMPTTFSRTARSAELLPIIVDYIGQAGQLHNRWYLIVLLIVWLIIATRTKTFLQAAEWSFFATYILSPMLHAWYFMWVLPFAVKSKNWGIIALGASGVMYYIVHYNTTLPNGGWIFTWWQRMLLWLPYVGGVLSFHYCNKDASIEERKASK